MAMISCPKCGNQISDKAPTCPNCGASFVPTANYTNAAGNNAPTQQIQQNTMPAQQSAVKSGSKAPVVIGIVAAIAVLAALFFIFFKPGENKGGNPGAVNNGGSVPSSVYTPPKESNPQQYSLKLVAECKKNSVMNQYDVDILFDDKYLDTLPHGAAKEYSLTCTKGSHTIEFRLNAKSITGENLYNVNDPGSYQIKTVNVSQNGTIGYHIEIDFGNTLKVVGV